MSKIYRMAIVLVLAASVDALALAAEVANPSVAFIQRTMTRIAQSTPQNPATVRFQFYGHRSPPKPGPGWWARTWPSGFRR